MSARYNYICICECNTGAIDLLACLQNLPSALSELRVDPVEVMRFDGATQRAELLMWSPALQESKQARLEMGTVLTMYFDAFSAATGEFLERHNISIEQREKFYILTLSFGAELVSDVPSHAERRKRWLRDIIDWAGEAFDTFTIAGGTELDLYESNEQTSLANAGDCFRDDWRCDALVQFFVRNVHE